MKKLSDIKNEKSLRDIYDKCMEQLADEMKGVIVVDLVNNDQIGMIVDVSIETQRGKRQEFKVKLLVDEKIVTRRFDSWHQLERKLRTVSDFEENKDVIYALRKCNESMQKASNRGYPRRRAKQNIRFK